MNMRSDTISIYEKARIFDEILYKIQSSYLNPLPDDEATSRYTVLNRRNKKCQMDLNLNSLENLILENCSASTSITSTVPEDEPRHWYEVFNDIYDTENCLINQKINAEHRNQLKLQGVAELPQLAMDMKIPEMVDQDLLSLDRHVVEPLQIELNRP